jgi:hypothetical protein
LWRICRKINVFSLGSNITCFMFYIHFWPTYLLSLVAVSFMLYNTLDISCQNIIHTRD